MDKRIKELSTYISIMFSEFDDAGVHNVFCTVAFELYRRTGNIPFPGDIIKVPSGYRFRLESGEFPIFVKDDHEFGAS